MTVRPRRSVLYMPGSNARAIEKARELPADGIILDLEDAVAPEAKVMAREQIRKALEKGGFGDREVFVRINGLDTRWWVDDLHAVADVFLTRCWYRRYPTRTSCRILPPASSTWGPI